MKIATHNGSFHADDIFSIAILKILYPDAKIIRTRDPKIFENADIKVDIGMKYNPQKGEFDHHQLEFKEKREDGIPYSSAGLVWKHFGMKLSKNRQIFNEIDKEIIEKIDADDNGIELNKENLYTFDKIIHILNPYWPQNNLEEQYQKQFEYALEFVIGILKREIGKKAGRINSAKIIGKLLKNFEEGFIILDEDMPWKDILTGVKNIKFVISPSLTEGQWYVNAVPLFKNSFEHIKLFPRDWAGLNGKDFAEKTGVNDAKFCHKDLFICGAYSKDGAIKLAKLALKN